MRGREAVVTVQGQEWRAEGAAQPAPRPDHVGSRTANAYWRVEGDLLPPDVARQALFFAGRAHGLKARVFRTLGAALTAPFVPLLDAADPRAGRRVLHALLRGISRDRLEFLGEEYVERRLVPRLRPAAVARLRHAVEAGEPVVLVSSWLQPVVRPLARRLGVSRIACNRLEYRDGRATGRLLDPIVGARGPLDWPLAAAAQPTEAPCPRPARPTVVYRGPDPAARLSVRETLRGRRVLLLGGTGFIGKVWLANLLRRVPDVERVWMLVRPRQGVDAHARFAALRESPVFRDIDPSLFTRRVALVEGDLTKPGLAVDHAVRAELGDLDLVVNSAGLTEFNPDLRLALAVNVEAALHVLEFARESGNAPLLHLSTCFAAGRRNGRIEEEIDPGRAPNGGTLDAEREYEELQQLAREIEVARERRARASARAEGHGWPNTYTYTKGLGEALLATRRGEVPLAVVRPSIVETSTHEPFRGWNEGVNTSAPLSYLLGTPFRQLPTRAGKRLDIIPVDLVTRGMTLVAAALVRRVHRPCYQLATSARNPCDMRRSIELTALAHRRHYRERPGLDAWMRRSLETVPVSRRRYRALSAPRQKALVRGLRRILPLRVLRRAERNLDRVEKLIELYEPFIHDTDQFFAADHVRLLDAALPPEERADFGYDAERIDWSEYWIDIHIPALRRWAYPLIEGHGTAMPSGDGE